MVLSDIASPAGNNGEVGVRASGVVRQRTPPDTRACMRPCRVCGRTNRRRMHALMTLWFGHYAGVPYDHGYFYLCPRCYTRYIPPPDPIARG
jgi:hypothetical protein